MGMSDDSGDSADHAAVHSTGLEDDDDAMEESTQLSNDMTRGDIEAKKKNTVGEADEDGIEARIKAVHDVFGDDDGLPDDEASISSGSNSEADESEDERRKKRRKKKRKFDDDGEPSSSEKKKRKKMRKKKEKKRKEKKKISS